MKLFEGCHRNNYTLIKFVSFMLKIYIHTVSIAIDIYSNVFTY